MKVSVISEYGLTEALLGMGLSFGKTSDKACFDLYEYSGSQNELLTSLLSRARKLSGLGLGHDKFLRMLTVYLDVTAPLYFWKEFDTYKVGTVAQSESTMHTLMHNPLRFEMFEGGLDEIILDHLNALRDGGHETSLNHHLPHSFLQRRVVMANYAVLQNILKQRKGHKLPEWKTFCDAVKDGCRHTTLLCPENKEGK